MSRQEDLFGEERAPYQRHSRTSKAARDAILSRLGRLEFKVQCALQNAGDEGLCDSEGMDITGLDGNTYRPRRIRLMELGLVKDSGRTRVPEGRTRSATVWVAL